VATAEKTAAGTWRARWRDHQGKTQGKSGFRTKTEAVHHAMAQETAVSAGTYIDPSAGKQTFEAYAERWREVQVHRRGTALQVEGNLRRNVYPYIGHQHLRSIRRTDIQHLMKQLSTKLALSTCEVVYRYVVAVFRAAVADKLIPENPCAGMKAPRPEKAKVVPLSVEQVHALADALPDRYRAMVILAAGTGLRQGEAFGLTVDRVDFLRRTLRVDQQLVLHAGSEPVLAPPKTPGSYRTIPLANAVLEALSGHMANHFHNVMKMVPDGLIFTGDKGRPIRRNRFGEVWRRAEQETGVDATFHDLRHFYASVLIRSGASVKVVQERLGHASAMETLDTYAHLFPDEEDRSRQAVEDVLRKSVSNPVSTGASETSGNPC
jgi:integrase